MSIDASLFASTALVERTIELPDGSKHVLHFRELTVTEFRRYQMAEASEDEAVRAGAIAKIIALSLRDAFGAPALTEEQAGGLTPTAANRLVETILSINKMDGAGEAGNAAAPDGSGTS